MLYPLVLQETKEFGQHHDRFRDFFHHFEGSPIFRFGVMSLVLKFLSDNTDSIEKDMEKHNQSMDT